MQTIEELANFVAENPPAVVVRNWFNDIVNSRSTKALVEALRDRCNILESELARLREENEELRKMLMHNSSEN